MYTSDTVALSLFSIYILRRRIIFQKESSVGDIQPASHY